jgi:hypothetical protein
MATLYNVFGKQFVCERKNWKTCPDHKHYSLTPPARFNVANIDIPSDEPMYSMDGPILTEEEFESMRAQGKFTVPVRLSQQEVDECDWDTLAYTFSKMIAGDKFTRNDSVVFTRDKTENETVFFTVTYIPS